LLDAAKAYPELLALLEDRITRATSDEARRALLFRKASIEENTLGDVNRAIETYVEVRSISQYDAQAVSALERLYQSTERWRDYAALLEDELVGAGTPDARANVLCRLADVSVSRLGDASGAVDRLASALEEKPLYPPAVAALEKLLSTPEEQLRIARLLESCYADAQQHAKLVGVLELQFSLLRAEPEAPELLQRIAELQEQQLQSPQAAYQAWRRAFLLNAEDERARGELERLAAQLSAQADLALVYSHLLNQGDRPLEDHLRASFLQREAELSEEPLGDIDRAISRWRDLAELDPAHRAALDALERLYLNKEDWTNLDETLVRKVRAAGSIEEEAELWHQIGEIRRDYLSSAEGAVQAYREALSLNASDRRAIAALKTLYRGQALHRELVELLTQELDLGGQDGSGSTEARLPLLYEVAEVFEKHLQDQEQAISSYNALLAEAPAERKAMQALDQLYEATEQHNELLDLLDREFDASQDAQERVLFRFRQGKIFEGKLLDNERAIDRYEEVLQANPAHLGAREALEALLGNEDTAQRSARVLEPVYRRAHDVPRLVAALELIGDRSDEPGERVVRYREAASHCEQDLGEPKRAFELLSKALKVEPGDDTLWVALDRLAPRAGGPKVVAQLLREVVDEATDPDLKVKLHLKLAELCRVDLRDLEGAESNYLKALEDDPQNAVALGALESLYEGVGRWRDLIEVLRRRIDGALDAAAQIPLWHRVAKLWETRKNFDEAIDAYEQILNIEPEERGALDALDGLYAAQGRWPDLLSLLERRLELVSSLPERVALRTRMADLHLTRTEDSSRALDEARAILREDPRNESSLSLLERLFEVPEQRIEVSELLEPLYARRLEWHKLARLLELRLEDDQSPEDRRQLATRLWMVREEQLEDLEGAFSALALLFREDPTDAQVRSRLSRFAELLNKWEDLAKALAVVAEDPGLAGDSGPSLCSDLAHIYEERLGRPEEAIPYLRQIVQDPNLGEEAAHTLEVLFRRLERWEDLFGLYQERAESAWEPQLQKELLRKGARLLENVIKDNDRAISVYQRILDIEEGDAQANEALDRLLSAESRWRDLVEYYLRRIDAIGDDPQVIELKFRLGQVYWQKLDELEPALDCYQDIIARVGDHEGAVFALEAIAKSPGLRRRAAEILEPIYEARGDWQKRIGLAESLLEIEEDVTEKIDLLTKVARLWENEGRAARRAFDAYLRAYALDVGAPNLRSELERLARGLGTWAELVQVTEAGIDNVSDSVTQGELLVEIGRIYEQELHNAPRATAAFERALSQDDSAEPVLDALDRLYEQSARHEDLARILSKKAELALSDDVRKRLYQRLALLSETAREDNEAAITAWREVLSLDPADPGANQNLERLYSQEKRNEDLAELYRQQLDQAANGEERRAVRFKLAQVQRDALNDPRAAIETFREVQNEFPDDLDALSALDALYTSEEQHAELLEVLERERALLSEGARVEIGLRMGDLLRGPLSEGERAISTYQEVLQESPQNPRARAALEQIAQDATLREAAAEVLAPLYQSTNDLEAQRGLYELRLEGLDDKPRRRELLLELARLCTEGLGDPKGAFDAYCRALKEDLGDEELSSIAERQARVCARILPSWETLAQVYEGSLSEVFDAEGQAKARLRLARIYSEELGRDDQAIKQLEEAADGGLTEPQIALSRLVALYEKAQRFPDIDRTLARQIDATLEPSQSVPLRLRRAELAVSHFKKPKDALDLYRAVLDDDRQNQAATDALSRLAEDEALRGQVVEILEPIYQERGDEESLSHLYEAELEILPRGGDRDRRLEQLAELYKGRLQSPTRAFFTLSRSFVDHPDEDSLLGELEQLSSQHRFEDELAVLLGEVLSAAPPLEIKGEAKKPAPVKPGLPAARPGLAAPVRPVASPLAAKKPQAAAAPQRASLAPPPALSQDVARELRLRLARLAKGPVEDAERALSLYQDVLKEDPEHQEALEAVIDLYEPTGRFAELADALLKRAEPEFELPKRRALLGKAATLYSEKLNEPKKALAAWKKIIEGDDSDLEARSAQEQLLETLGEFAALAESLSSHILFVEDNAQAAELIYRRGVILEQKLKKPKEAMDAFREALDRSQNHEPALIALERLYDAQGKHQDLQELLLRRLDDLQGADRAPTLVRLAHLSEERFKSRADATQYYRDALAVAPNHPEANAGLLRLLEADGNWQEVVSRLNARISEAPGEAPALYLRLGEIYEQRIKDEAAAISAFRQALDVAPGNNAALVALARLHEKRGEWDDVTRIFEVVVEGSQGEAKLDLAVSTANLHHSKRNDAASAERVLNSVATRPAIQPKILQALRDLFTKESAWTKLAELVALDAEIQTETPKKLQALLEAAKLIQEKQKDPLAALPYMERAHALDANLLSQLADLYLATGRLAEASQAFEKMFAAHKAARRNKDAAKCMQRLGAIAEKAGDLKTAQEKFKSAYESDPSNPEILASYGGLLFKNQEIEPATKIFRALLLIPPGATPPMPKPEIYLRLGQLNAMAGQPQKAIDMFKRGLEFDAQNAALKEALASVTAPK
jgi:tetratricopeptide (TPR) repeat protein